FDALPLTFTYVGQAEAPEGHADVVDVRDASSPLVMRLFVSAETHLPLMISWKAAARNPQQAALETRLYFAEYHTVDGLQWPFRVRQALGANTVEETTIDRFRINPKIDPKKFETRSR